MASRRPSRRGGRNKRSANSPPSPVLRIVGGKYRGSKLEHHGDEVTRPMKDRTREAVFNLLGPGIAGGHAIDLFAGTGALGLEAISRGAARATLIERHFPTANVIDRNVAALGLENQCEVLRGDTFHVSRRSQVDASRPWIVFCSPPYDLFLDRGPDMLELIATWIERAPAGSRIVVESDSRFDVSQLPRVEAWDIRKYPPAVVAIAETDALKQSPDAT